MAWMQCSVYSEILEKTVNMDVIIPEPDLFYSREELLSVKGFQTIYLLHGKGYDSTDWIKNTSVERYAMENQAAVVMPSVNGGKYESEGMENNWMYLTKECIAIAEFYFPLSTKKEDRFVMGAEQGGSAALRWAVEAEGTFAKAIDISSEKKRDGEKAVQDKWDAWDRELEQIFRTLPLKRDIYYHSYEEEEK